MRGCVANCMRYLNAGRILVVDDEPGNIVLIRHILANQAYEVETATSGEAALEQVPLFQPELILLDVNMPGIDGFEVCRRLKANPRTKLIPVVLLTGRTALDDRIRGIEAGADDVVTKPFARSELTARIRSLIRLKRYTDELDSAEAVILSLARIIEARDPYTGGHCDRLGQYACALGLRLGLDADQQIALRRAGILHDVGKIAVPDAVLLKTTPLDAAEWAVMKCHPVIGDQLCRELRLLDDVSPIVRHHHERLNGSGYPDHLKADRIPLLAQIISVVDTYDAITTPRPYRPAGSMEHACAELHQDVARGWKSAQLVAEFTGMVSQSPIV
jgi:putative two-component system response regulator